MPDYALVEYTINTGDAEPLYKLIYNLLINEFNILRDNLEEFLEKRYIQRLISPAGAPILFIFKKKMEASGCAWTITDLIKLLKRIDTYFLL